MPRRSTVAQLLFIAIAASVAAQAAGQDAGTCSTPTDKRAVQRLKDKIRSDHLYASWTSAQCLWFDPEDCNRHAVEVAIHEIHDERCGGDPATSPVVDRFRVFKNRSGSTGTTSSSVSSSTTPRFIRRAGAERADFSALATPDLQTSAKATRSTIRSLTPIELQRPRRRRQRASANTVPTDIAATSPISNRK